MKLTRILAALLATLMLVGSLAACGGPVEEPDATTAPDGTAAATETQGETELTDDLPDDLDYDGDQITILSQYREGWTSGEIAVPELINEPVNDAVYERNKAVEERLNVTIVSIAEASNNAYDVVEKDRVVIITRL